MLHDLALKIQQNTIKVLPTWRPEFNISATDSNLQKTRIRTKLLGEKQKRIEK